MTKLKKYSNVECKAGDVREKGGLRARKPQFISNCEINLTWPK